MSVAALRTRCSNALDMVISMLTLIFINVALFITLYELFLR